MRESHLLTFTSTKRDSTSLATSRKRPRRVLPFYLIEGAVVCSDAFLILITSLSTGILYHLALFASVGPVEAFLGIGALTFVNFSAILAARGAYRPQTLADPWKQVGETTATWLFVSFVLLAAAFSLKISETYSRGAILTFFAAGWFAVVVWHFIIARFIVKALATGAFAEQKTILIVEEGQLAGSGVIDELKRCGYTPAGIFEFAPRSVSPTRASPQFLKSMREITELSRQEPIGCVFLLMSWGDWRSVEHLIGLLRVLSAPVYLLPDENVAHFLSSRIVNVGTTRTIELRRSPLTTTEQASKRVLDLLLASAGLVILAPLIVMVAALIKVDSQGPAFFVQTRIGFNGRQFRIYKFRTMFVAEDGPVIHQATRNDPRNTPIGRLLRRTNIDELPQLWNVIVGDMSLVGPRPHASAHNTKYEEIIGNYAFRHHVKPGLTGWAQVNGLRGETQTVELMTRRVEFDLWYIDNWSFWLDFRILLRTFILGLQPNAY